MKKLTAKDLWSNEDYAEQRPEFRKKVIAHKNARKLPLGPNMMLLFEDRLLIHYQIQEMLRIEGIVEKEAVEEELFCYNPLIPDGTNWKVTCLIEYENVNERVKALKELKGVEERIYGQIGDGERFFAIADEDMAEGVQDKTAAVHFLRFEIPEADIKAIKGGAELHFGVDHPKYEQSTTVPAVTRDSLVKDLA